MAAAEIQPGDSVIIFWPKVKKKNDENHNENQDQDDMYHGILLSINAERTFAKIRFDEEGGGKKANVSLKYISKLEIDIPKYVSSEGLLTEKFKRSETSILSLQSSTPTLEQKNCSSQKSTPRSTEQPKKKKRRLSTNLTKHAQTVASSKETNIIPHFHTDQVSDFHVLGYIEIQVPSTPRERSYMGTHIIPSSKVPRN